MSRDDQKLLDREAKRNIAEELLEAVRDVKAGKISRKITVEVTKPAARSA